MQPWVLPTTPPLQHYRQRQTLFFTIMTHVGKALERRSQYNKKSVGDGGKMEDDPLVGEKRPKDRPAMVSQLMQWCERNLRTSSFPYGLWRWSPNSTDRRNSSWGVVDDIDESSACLTVRLEKRITRHSQGVQTHLKPIPMYVADRLRTMGAGKEHGSFIFPPEEAPYSQALRTIKRAAQELQWPTDLNFGTHALRCESTQAMQQQVERVTLQFWSQMSACTARHYARQ